MFSSRSNVDTVLYNTVQMFGVCKSLMFLNEVSSAHQGCIYLIKKYSKNFEIFLEFKITVICVNIC